MADKSPEAKLQEIAERRQRRQESFAFGTTSPPPTTSSATSTSATSATSTSSSASASVPAQPRQPRSPPPHTPAKRTLSQGNGLEKAGKDFLFSFWLFAPDSFCRKSSKGNASIWKFFCEYISTGRLCVSLKGLRRFILIRFLGFKNDSGYHYLNFIIQLM